MTPLKGVLKKSYTPKKGSAQEELAQQLELRSGTLRDASEVLSEMREWRNRKNVDSNPSKVSLTLVISVDLLIPIAPNAEEKENRCTQPQAQFEEAREAPAAHNDVGGELTFFDDISSQPLLTSIACRIYHSSALWQP